MRCLPWLLLLVSVGFAGVPAYGQMPYAGAPCGGADREKVSPAQAKSFTQFDTQLRAALRQKNVAALAFLVKFPLRVNSPRGTLLIPDAQSLEGHFAEIFTPAVVERVLATERDDYICRYDEGLGYLNGVIWVSTNGKKFGLDAINGGGSAAAEAPKVQYTCETKTHRIAITMLKGDTLRYQSWNKSKPVTGPADVDLLNGTMHYEGTGVCAYAVYAFTKGEVRYEVEKGIGCSDGTDPAKATGHLNVFISDKQVTDAWCF